MMAMSVPQPSDAFEWTQADGARVLTCRTAPAACRAFLHRPRICSSATTRPSGASWRRSRACPRIGSACCDQVHGRTVVAAGRDNDVAWDRPEADAIISDDPSVALVVRVADCAPVLLADTVNGAVAAVHAGWRSTMQRIVVAAIDALRDTYGTRPADLMVAIGPSLGACCGEMGEEVVEAFAREGHPASSLDRWFRREAGRRPHFDLWLANRDQLEAAGVPASSIHGSGLCTKTHAGAFHSWRAAGQAAGRMAAVIRAV